jgi:hypothetical protein
MAQEPVQTYGAYLKQFARTVDIISEQTWSELEVLVTRYVINDLSMSYFEFMKEEMADEGGVARPALRSVWVSDGTPKYKLVTDANGDHNGQTAFAFDKGTPLWIVAADRGPLSDASRYEDLWSDTVELPKYVSTLDEIRTSIVLPVRNKGRLLGLIDLESKTYRRPSMVGRKELERLADALGILYTLHDARETQTRGTKDAIRELENLLNDRRFPTRLSTPQIFLASSHEARDDVVAAIKELITQEFGDSLELVHWKDMSEGGNINTQILAGITTARFGICYFSEPAPPGSAKAFRDNANVVFEAGMLHALTNAPTEEPRHWIPIREEASPTAPFDFASERMITVARDGNGQINREALIAELRRRIRGLLG